METEQAEGGTLETWTPDEVRDAMEKGEIALIDVRTPQEYAFEHVRGALLLPMHEMDPALLPAQDGKRVVFHCGSGKRSEAVARKALAAGWEKVAHMGGGFGAWKQAKLPHVTIDMASGQPKDAP